MADAIAVSPGRHGRIGGGGPALVC